MDNPFLQSLMQNNIHVLEDFYEKSDKLKSINEEDDREEFYEDGKKKKKEDVKTIVLDWISLNNRENEKFLKLENGEEEDSDDDYDNDSDSSDGESDKSDDEDEQNSEDEDEEDESKLTEKEKIEKHDKLLDKQERKKEKEEKEFKYDELSKFYCYRILIEFVREIKSLEDKLNSKNESLEEYVYRKYDHDFFMKDGESNDNSSDDEDSNDEDSDNEESDDKKCKKEDSFLYKMNMNQIAIKTVLDNESHISFLMFCFEVVFDNKPEKLNKLRKHIIETLQDFDISYISRIKKLKTMSVQNWFTLFEDSMSIPIGDFVKFEFNYDKSKIIEKTIYEFDNNITEENVENIRFYTIQDIMNMYEQKIFENRILAKYN